jgi:hypothetical protein
MADEVTVEVTADPDGTGLMRRALSLMHEEGGVDRLAGFLADAAEEAVHTAGTWVDLVRASDPVLAWMLLYVLDRGDVPGAVEVYAREALRFVEREQDAGCNPPSDAQVLVGMLGAEALGHRAMAGEDGAFDALLQVVAEQVEPAIRVEAARAAFAVDPSVEERLVELMGDDAGCVHWEVVSAESLLTEDHDTIGEVEGTLPPDGVLQSGGVA